MQIKLTKDLSPKKGLVKGAIFNWRPATRRAISEQIGIEDGDWYVVLGPDGEDPREDPGGNRADPPGK